MNFCCQQTHQLGSQQNAISSHYVSSQPVGGSRATDHYQEALGRVRWLVQSLTVCFHWALLHALWFCRPMMTGHSMAQCHTRHGTYQQPPWSPLHINTQPLTPRLNVTLGTELIGSLLEALYTLTHNPTQHGSISHCYFTTKIVGILVVRVANFPVWTSA